MEHAITQADCTECDTDLEAPIEVRDRDASISSDPDADPAVTYVTECDSCGESAVLTVTEEGMSVDGPVSFENASWNDSSE